MYHDARSRTVIFSNNVPYRSSTYKTAPPLIFCDHILRTSEPKVMTWSQMRSATSRLALIVLSCGNPVAHAPTAAILQHTNALNRCQFPHCEPRILGYSQFVDLEKRHISFQEGGLDSERESERAIRRAA